MTRDKEFIVGWISWFDHDLVLEQIFAKNWKEAVFTHSCNLFETLNSIPDSIDTAKSEAFNMDGMFDVIEVV